MTTFNPIDHRTVVGAILTTLNTSLVRKLREQPDDTTLADTLFSVERTLRQILHMPRRSRTRALVAVAPRIAPSVRTRRATAAQPRIFLRGDTVQAYHEPSKQWYAATVVHRRSDGGYRVEWSNGVRHTVNALQIKAS